MSVKLLTENHLEFLGLKGGCTGSSESTLVKMPNRWKSHVTAKLTAMYTTHGERILTFSNPVTEGMFGMQPGRTDGLTQ